MKNLLLPLAILISIITGCDNSTKKKPHNHGLEPFNQTVFSDNYEVYITSKPFVVGKENKLIVHVTDFSREYSPYTSSVNMIYRENDEETQNEKLTTTTNTFELSITPKEEGTGIITFQIGQEEISTNYFKVYVDEHAAEEIGHHDLGPTEVGYKKSQLWNIEFETQLSKYDDFNEVIATAGEIKSAPGDEVIVSAKSSGIVIFAQEGMTIGKPIAKGSGMFVISNNDISVDNIDTKFQQAKVNLDLAKVNYERNLDLIKDQIISQKELIDSKAAYENAQIDYNTHAKNYSKGGIKVTSIISGYLKNLLVSEGQYVVVGTPLATISQNKKLLIEADLTQKDFGKIKQFKNATFKMVGSENVYHTDSLNGELILIGTSISPDHPFIPISIEVDNVGDLISGAMVEIFLHANITIKEITVPRSALLEEQGVYSIFTQVDGETFVKHEVKLGSTDGENYVIISGLEPNQRVVTKGVYQLKLAMASGSLPAHTHEH